ncbi:MAG: hypothetical protein KGS72_07600 [Cyanobacteria bacterium REEB67]|nr:hypothetical protein [Cyanobacteria bacterium REEB67]
MGIKNIKAMALSAALTAASVACIAASPAMANNNNNNRYLNQLAMQMYLQNQSAAYNPYLYNNYNNPYSNYGAYGAYGYNGQTPWSAGAMPYGYVNGGYNAYNNRYCGPRACYHHEWWR